MLSEVDRFLADAGAVIDQEMERRVGAGIPDEWLRGALAYHHGWADERWEPLPAAHRARGGKKVRPALVVLCAGAVSGAAPSADLGDVAEPIVAFACALEFAHNFSLIHDDIEDRDRIRRGRPTLWTVCGEAQAINAGDALHALAHLTVNGMEAIGTDSATAAELRAAFGEAILAMTVGQRLDMTFEDMPDVTASRYVEMIAGKTGAIMACAAFGGARLALGTDGGAVVVDGLRRFGLELGLAFQIRDDILGIWGVEEETGKSTSGDIRRRKKSYPVLRAMALADGPGRRRLLELYAPGGELSDMEAQEVRAILDSCGAQLDATEGMATHAAAAERALEVVDPEVPAVQLLHQLVRSLTTRTT